jgi:ABC-type multidrug transport system permease subunit
MENQYPFLRISVWITKVLSYAVAGLAVVAALVIFFGKAAGTNKLAGLGALLMGGIYFLFFYLASDLIRLFLNMHERMERLEAVNQSAKKEIR